MSASHALHGSAAEAVRHNAILAVVWVVVLFSNVPVYLGNFVIAWPQPIHWIEVMAVAWLLFRDSTDHPAQPISLTFLAPLLVYACVCLVWFIAVGGGDPLILRQRLLSLAVSAVSYLIFSQSESSLRSARIAVAWVVVFSVLMNAFDLGNPFYLVPASSEYSNIGRAAGFFVNPNQSGAALTLGFALSVGVVPRRWRVPYFVLVAAGVAMTLSRGAIIGLVLVAVALTAITRTLRVRDLLLAFGITGLVGWAAWSLVSAEIQATLSIDPTVLIQRLFWLLDPAGNIDDSQSERLDVLEAGWRQFMASPLWGNGIGSTELWQRHISTHNLYVMLASDFGVLGFAVLPAIVAIPIATAWRVRSDALVACLFLLFWAIFSHNVLGEFYLVVGLGLTAALAELEASRADRGLRQVPNAALYAAAVP